MNRNNTAVFFAIIILFVSHAAGQIAARPDSSTLKVENLGWLAGCWERAGKDNGRTMTEMWMKPAGGLMLGVSRSLTKDAASGWEFMRLEERGGTVYFVARPSENPGDTAFKIVRFGVNEAVFEAPDHDFPQRVIYRRRGESLEARIEGTLDGKAAAVDFSFKKIPCD